MSLGAIALSEFMAGKPEWPAVKPRGWEHALPPGAIKMLGNDHYGICLPAAMMHYAQTETAAAGSPLTPTLAHTIQVYTDITGFDPKLDQPDGTNPTDNGTYYRDALRYWQQNGIPLLDAKGNEVIHKIIGWASLDLSSVAQQRWATDVFGGTMMGINCPASAMNDLSDWRYVPGSPTLGGHAINRVGQGRAGWHIDSWGRVIPGTWEFSLNLADEDYVVVTPSWLNQQGKSPSGFDLDGLVAAMRKVKQH